MNYTKQELVWGIFIVGFTLLLIYAAYIDSTRLDVAYTDEGNSALTQYSNNICVRKYIHIRYYDEVSHTYLHYQNQSDGVSISPCYNITVPINRSFWQMELSGYENELCINWVNNSCEITRITIWHIRKCDWVGDPTLWIV